MFSSVFKLGMDYPFPYFEKNKAGYKQNIPLRLRSTAFENEVFEFLKKHKSLLDKFKLMIPSKKLLKMDHL
jgi:hypothetical protein